MAVFRPLVLPQLERGATRATASPAPDVETILAANSMFALMAMASNWHAFELVEHAVTTAEKVGVVLYSTPSAHPLYIICTPSNTHLKDPDRVPGARNVMPDPGLIDPHTLALARYAALSDDRTAAQWACEYAPSHAQSALWSPLTHAVNGGPLKVGYLSFDWRDHPMGRLTQSLVTGHNGSRIHSTAFSYGVNDGSTGNTCRNTTVTTVCVCRVLPNIPNNTHQSPPINTMVHFSNKQCESGSRRTRQHSST